MLLQFLHTSIWLVSLILYIFIYVKWIQREYYTSMGPVASSIVARRCLLFLSFVDVYNKFRDFTFLFAAQSEIPSKLFEKSYFFAVLCSLRVCFFSGLCVCVGCVPVPVHGCRYAYMQWRWRAWSSCERVSFARFVFCLFAYRSTDLDWLLVQWINTANAYMMCMKCRYLSFTFGISAAFCLPHNRIVPFMHDNLTN